MTKDNGCVLIISLVNFYFDQEEQATLMRRLFSHHGQKILAFPAMASGPLMPQPPTQQQLN